jgi:hypothetical protein
MTLPTPHLIYSFFPGLGVLLLVSMAALGLCVAGLAFNILVRKNGKFPETEVGKNQHMRKLGITCVKQDEIRRNKPKQEKEAAMDCSGCSGCGDVKI